MSQTSVQPFRLDDDDLDWPGEATEFSGTEWTKLDPSCCTSSQVRLPRIALIFLAVAGSFLVAAASRYVWPVAQSKTDQVLNAPAMQTKDVDMGAHIHSQWNVETMSNNYFSDNKDAATLRSWNGMAYIKWHGVWRVDSAWGGQDHMTCNVTRLDAPGGVGPAGKLYTHARQYQFDYADYVSVDMSLVLLATEIPSYKVSTLKTAIMEIRVAPIEGTTWKHICRFPKLMVEGVPFREVHILDIDSTQCPQAGICLPPDDLQFHMPAGSGLREWEQQSCHKHVMGKRIAVDLASADAGITERTYQERNDYYEMTVPVDILSLLTAGDNFFRVWMDYREYELVSSDGAMCSMHFKGFNSIFKH